MIATDSTLTRTIALNGGQGYSAIALVSETMEQAPYQVGKTLRSLFRHLLHSDG